jgi:hypothetical protein
MATNPKDSDITWEKILTYTKGYDIPVFAMKA